MKTLDGPIWSKCRVALTYPAGHISSAHRTGKDGDRVTMNVAAHQEKEKNDNTKTVQRKAREERRQATNFKEGACCPSAGV